MGLKPADFDAMTAAARDECGAYGKINECSGLTSRGQTEQNWPRVSGNKIVKRWVECYAMARLEL